MPSNPTRKPSLHTRAQGKYYELAAENYLKQHGLHTIGQNWQAKCGEIDLIMHDPLQHMLVFVEVRFRRSAYMGNALESITRRKYQAISRTANYFLVCNPVWRTLPCRIDVIACQCTNSGLELSWYPHATFS